MAYVSSHGWLAAILVGLIVGLMAKLIMPGRYPGGLLVTILVGMAGSLLAGYAGSALFGWYRDGSSVGWIMSILGAVVLLWVWRLINRNRGM